MANIGIGDGQGNESDIVSPLERLGTRPNAVGTYVICLVGFNNTNRKRIVHPDPEATHSLPEILPQVIPEAEIYQYSAFTARKTQSLEDLEATSQGNTGAADKDNPKDGNDRAGEAISDTDTHQNANKEESGQPEKDTGLQIYSDSIKTEALVLLDALQNQLCGPKNDWKEILLAGYGLGGLIIKQAIIFANKDPLYYRVALQISHLVFFATPHRNYSLLSWENLLVSIVHDTGLSLHGRLSETLPELVDDITELSSAFYGLARKYKLVNVIEGKGMSEFDGPVVGELGTLGDNTKYYQVVKKLDHNLVGLPWFNRNDLSDLQFIRDLFVPQINQLIGSTYIGNTKSLYLRLLQMLSSSRWFIHDSASFESLEVNLEGIYTKHLKSLKLDNLEPQTSIWIVGPAGFGKASLLRSICQKIRETMSRVIIEYVSEPNKDTDTQTYSMLVTCVHQILSQRPDLFSRIETLISEYFDYDTWAEPNLWMVLSSLISNCPDIQFAFAFDLKQFTESGNGCLGKEERHAQEPGEAVRSWMEKLKLFLNRHSVNYIYIISAESSPADDALSSVPPLILDVAREKQFTTPQAQFIEQKVDLLIKNSQRLRLLRKGVNNELRCALEAKVRSFGGSFGATDLFTRFIGLHKPQLLAPDAIKDQIDTSPSSLRELYKLRIQELANKSPTVLNWCSLGLSWVLRAFRPLRVEELAVAVAIDLQDQSFANLDKRISRDPESDLDQHMEVFVKVKNGFVYPIDAKGRLSEIVKQADPHHHLEIREHVALTQVCLHYLSMVLAEPESDGEWEAYLVQLYSPWKQQSSAKSDMLTLEFLDYAVRNWVEHFIQCDVLGDATSLRPKVVKFLNNTRLRDRWFQAYLKANASFESRFKTEATEQLSNPPKTAEDIARYFGLSSTLQDLGVVNDGNDVTSQTIQTKRGYSIRSQIFPNTSSEEYITGLVCASDTSTVQQLTKLFDEKQADVGAFPVVAVTQSGCLEVVKYLVSKDWFDGMVKELQIDSNGCNLLCRAVLSGDLEIVQHLLKLNSGTELLKSSIETIRAPMLAFIIGAVAILDCLKEAILQQNYLLPPPSDWSIVSNFSVGYLKFVEECFQDGLVSGSDLLNLPFRSALLHQAVYSRDSEAVDYILKSQSWKDQVSNHVNRKIDNGRTALHMAAMLGDIPIIEKLIGAGADTEASDSEDLTPADLAARSGNLQALKRLQQLQKEIALTPLVAAARAGQLLIVKYFLKEAPLNSDRESQYELALRVAAKQGHEQLVRELLSTKLDPNCKNAEGGTPLHQAAEEGQLNIAKLLIEHSANIHAEDSGRYSPLHLAAKNGRIEVVRFLIEHGADVNAENQNKTSPLHLCTNYPELVALLLEKKADVNATDFNSRSPISIASGGDVEQKLTVELLLKAGADINVEDRYEKTPLQRAISKGFTDTVIMLFMHNNHLLSQSPSSLFQILYCAIEGKNTKILEHLLKALVDNGTDIVSLTSSTKSNLLNTAARYSVDCLKILLEIEPKLPWESVIDNADIDGFSALYDGAWFGNRESVEVLCNSGASLNINATGGWSALHVARYYTEISELLISHGADVNAVSTELYTPLMLACQSDYSETTKLLIKQGANLELENSVGQTALHLSASNGQNTIAEILLGSWEAPSGFKVPVADVQKTDNKGRTALYIAIKAGKPNVSKLLIEHKSDIKVVTNAGKTCLGRAMKHGSTTGKELLEVIATATKAAGIEGPIWPLDRFEELLKQHFKEKLDERIFPLIELEPALLDDKFLDYNLLRHRQGNRALESEQEALAVKLLDKGFNPFKERNGFSVFQDAFTSRWRRREEFLAKCTTKLSDHLSDIGSGFREIRRAIEVNDINLLKILSSFNDGIADMVDDDGWSMAHIVAQSQLPLSSLPENLPKTPVGTPLGPSSMLFPRVWKKWNLYQDVEDTFEVCDGDLGVIFNHRVYMDGWDDKRTWRELSLRSDRPFQPSSIADAPKYFEIEIQSTSETLKEMVRVGIGACGEFTYIGNGFPGWNVWSVGYHGDDGGIYEGDGDDRAKVAEYGVGQTVGFGVDYEGGEYFFTRDGNLECRYKPRDRMLVHRKLYPTIAHAGGGCKVAINFGQKPFKWTGLVQKQPKPVERRPTIKG
ncbi:hypothetical protein H072_4032 [Dactylellina haptotyla CBS 200.50]|uniref:B30.2/SPRY domain-containing protein n=1 Tax=Dactylellina haptotyla (strain CBS 200.50) TaxID=1284197 RepID=S8AGH3_DACHA|nr:hypothetical protein H072_4032 [Dactylellina haptotyla CBS 200.50]